MILRKKKKNPVRNGEDNSTLKEWEKVSDHFGRRALREGPEIIEGAKKRD